MEREADINAPMIHESECARVRVKQIASLMGGPTDAVDAAIKRLDAAMASYPHGSLVLTYGPYACPHTPQWATFANLCAIWWQDDEYGVHFNELVWDRRDIK